MTGDRRGQLAGTLGGEFEETARLRRPHEQRWLKDLRVYKGKYDPEVEENFKKGCSKVFIRMGTVKVDNILARGMDLTFPGNGEDNWSISPTPIAEADKATMSEVYGVGLDDKDALQAAAKKACVGMSTAMKDQLVGDDQQSSYRDVCRNVMFHGVLFGTGVFKGPLVKKRNVTRYSPKKDEGGKIYWDLVVEHEERYSPQYGFVPLWDFFPDMSALKITDCRFVWETHLYTKQNLLELADRRLFDADKIRAHIKDNPDGDASLAEHEQEVRGLSDGKGFFELKGRYRIRERWGYLTGEQLASVGVEVEEGQEANDFASNVWMVGDTIIKAVVAPLRGNWWPYQIFHFRKDESCLFGEGVPSRLRDPQSIINGAARMMLEAGAMSAGYIGELNLDMLASGEEVDPTPYPNRIFLTRKGQAEASTGKALELTTMSSGADEYMRIIEFARGFADDLTLPRYQHGNAKVSGAGKTARGLSMLMSAANIDMRELVKGFDDTITEPFMRALYRWNMQFNEDNTIKGDYEVVAKGSSTLIAKEVQAQQLMGMAQVSDSERFRPFIKDYELMLSLARANEVTSTLVRTEEEQAQYLSEQTLQNARANVQALTEEFEKHGGDKEALLLHIAQAIAQQTGAIGETGGDYAQVG